MNFKCDCKWHFKIKRCVCVIDGGNWMSENYKVVHYTFTVISCKIHSFMLKYSWQGNNIKVDLTGRGCDLNSTVLGLGAVAGSYEDGNEPLGCTDDNKFLDHMSDCLLLKNDCCIKLVGK